MKVINTLYNVYEMDLVLLFNFFIKKNQLDINYKIDIEFSQKTVSSMIYFKYTLYKVRVSVSQFQLEKWFVL